MTFALRRERGFALLIVLWTLTLLALIASVLTATGRSEVKLSENLRDAALAAEAADGATYEAIFQLAAGTWAPGPLPHMVRIGKAVVAVRIEDIVHLADPNHASPDLMAALLRVLGTDARTAQTLGAAIENFRDAAGADSSAYVAAGLPYGPSRENYRNVAELRLVPGMTPALYARLAPHLSIAGLPFVVPDVSDPVVAAACRDVEGECGPPEAAVMQMLGDTLVARITATATAGTAKFSRVADVHLAGETQGPPRPPYQIMSWGRPDD